ncbi:MAG: glucosaminidase domain-containing protein [Paludibacteraceae bacterium]
MKRNMFVVAFAAILISPLFAQGQQQNPLYLQYIAQWRDVVVANQQNYGIPASITMAQALLESAAGTSELAINAKNHFGIKCTSEWTGETYLKDDDKKDDCFRVYNDAKESFDDHSAFLHRARYQPLFEIAVEDYAGWANGLKKCGYATDAKYPQKLVKLIEDYRLDLLADKDWSPASNGGSNATQRPVVVKKTEPIAVISSNPEPEYVESLSAKEERQLFLLTHKTMKYNGVKYVVALEGDTYPNVAFRLNITERSLREWNDALDRTLHAGDRIYLAKKKPQALPEKALVWVAPGESLWEICQREAVQMKKVQECNGFLPSIRIFKTRQQILLAKPKK